MGGPRLLTVVSPEAREGTESGAGAGRASGRRPFKQALVADGIPFSSFAVDDSGSGRRP